MTIGVTASMLLLSLGANAQTIELGLKGNKSSYEMLAPMKLTPAERKAKLAESIAKHPLLHKRLVPQTAKRDTSCVLTATLRQASRPSKHHPFLY